MKKILSVLLLLLCAGANATTTVPSTLINWVSAPSAPSQTASFVFAAPNGSAGVPVFRQLIASDIPTLAPLASASPTGTWAFAARPTFNGNTPYDTGNLTIANYATLASPTFTGTVTAANVTATGTLTGFTGRLINIQVLTSGGTYTPTTGTGSIIARLQGGGGGGGGASLTGAAQISCGAPGGAGGYSEHRATSGFSGATIAVGGAGTAGTSGGAGGAGGNTTGFGVAANGGSGGAAGTAVSVPNLVNGTSGGTATGGSIVNVPGAIASAAGFYASNLVMSAAGANSPLGSGAVSRGTATTIGGLAATGFGAGGSPGCNAASQSATTGGAGTAGIVIIYEFSN